MTELYVSLAQPFNAAAGQGKGSESLATLGGRGFRRLVPLVECRVRHSLPRTFSRAACTHPARPAARRPDPPSGRDSRCV